MTAARRLAVALVGTALFAGLSVVGGATPASAADCDPDTIVFSSTGVLVDSPGVEGLPEPVGSEVEPQPRLVGIPLTTDWGQFGCLASPDAEFNTRTINAVSTHVRSRLTRSVGSAPWYRFHGVVNGEGQASLKEGLVPGTFFAESPRIAIDPAMVGCFTASFDGYRGTEYCTISHLTP
ncbi:MAG TPA: hypothetical protein VNE62_06585 [Actinomycetota bacterium]|nr:hypothetical protein [Actinomycetota bacterium]